MPDEDCGVTRCLEMYEYNRSLENQYAYIANSADALMCTAAFMAPPVQGQGFIGIVEKIKNFSPLSSLDLFTLLIILFIIFRPEKCLRLSSDACFPA